MNKLASHWQILIALVVATVLATLFRTWMGHFSDTSWQAVVMMRVY